MTLNLPKVGLSILVITSFGCGDKGASKGGGPNRTPAPRPDGELSLEGSPEAKDPATFEELLKKVKPDFVSGPTEGAAVSKTLKAALEVKFSSYIDFRTPSEVPSLAADDEILESGSSCKPIYGGFLTSNIDFFDLEAQSISASIQYGISETERDGFSRKKIADLPAYAGMAYEERNITETDNGDGTSKKFVDYEKIYLGSNKDQLLIATETRNESLSESFKRCVRLVDNSVPMMRTACSNVYNPTSNTDASRTDWVEEHSLKNGLYSFSADDRVLFLRHKPVTYSMSVRQTAANQTSFVQDFRNYYTAADAGIIFGVLFPSYAYAAGDLEYVIPPADPDNTSDGINIPPRRATECKVKSVRFSE